MYSKEKKKVAYMNETDLKNMERTSPTKSLVGLLKAQKWPNNMNLCQIPFHFLGYIAQFHGINSVI